LDTEDRRLGKKNFWNTFAKRRFLFKLFRSLLGLVRQSSSLAWEGQAVLL